MSMESNIIYGFGFNCDCDDDKLIDFVKMHKNAFCKSKAETQMYKEMLKYTENQYDLEDFFDRYSCESNGMEGNGAVISNIMSRETGIRFMYCPPDGDCDTYASVLFELGYPWSFNTVEKELTKEKLFDICKKYIDELGIITTPNYLELEYYG